MDNKLTEYVLKHSKKRDKELKYDFMPSLLEIIERPAHKAGTVIILSVFSMLIVAVIWACCSKIDVVVTSSGTIQPVGNISSLNSYASGTIKSINVEEGSYVEAGDVLIELDTQSLDIDVDTLQNQKKVLDTQKKIYSMIINNEDISDIDVTQYELNLQPYIRTIINTDLAYHNNLSTLESVKENAGLNRDIAKIKAEEYRVNSAISQADYDAQNLVVKQTENEYIQAETNLLKAQISYSEQINANLSEINGSLSQIEAQIEKYQLSIEYQKITAPVNGYINSISVNNIGETVTSAQQVITIVPADTPVEMVCYIKNMDIAEIEVGMDAEIKLEAYPYNKYGTVKGTVKYISPSSFNSEQLGSVYLVKLDMPNKPSKRILESIKFACDVFGKGKVSSNIILGLGETDENILILIERLAEIGAIATLYPYDPTSCSSVDNNFKRPSAERIYNLAIAHKEILEHFSLNTNSLLTMCPACAASHVFPGKDL